METRTFLEAVLPHDGNYFTLITTPNNRIRQYPAPSIDALEDRIKDLIAHKRNTFIALASYKDTSNRKSNNVLHKKVFHLDVDCGKGKAYPSKVDALRAIKEFFDKTKLCPPSLIVDSGNGLHVYWVLNELITRVQWLSTANQIKQLCIEHNFRADEVVTADVTRVLRVPGSMNYKDPDHPVPCKVLIDRGKQYSHRELRESISSAPEPPPQRKFVVDNSDLETCADLYSTGKFPAASGELILNECKVLKLMKDTGGKHCSEPEWMHALAIMAYCEDGRDHIHQLSNLHPDYNYNRTEQKFKSRISAIENGVGPTTCSTFHHVTGGQCVGCDHWGVIKSPIQLGHAEPDGMALPRGYYQTSAGVYRSDKDGKPVFVAPFTVVNCRLMLDTDQEELFVHAELDISGKSHRLILEVAKMYDWRNVHISLARAMIVTTEKQTEEVKMLMTSWAQQMQKAKRITRISQRMGWIREGDTFGFCTGSLALWPKGVQEPSTMADRATQRQYTPLGTIDAWKKAAVLIVGSGDYSLMAGLASAFAAPLMSFTGVSGAMLSLESSKSGTGKTSTLRTAQAAWGHPKLGMNSLDDTPKSVSYRLGMVNNLPIYWDELRMPDQVRPFVKFMFRLGQGRDRQRLKSDISMAESGQWDSLITVGTNESILDHATAMAKGTDAGIMRVLELSSENVKAGALYDSQRTFGDLDFNYGHAGVVYAQWLVENRAKIAADVAKLTSTIGANLGGNDYRFQVAIIATLTLGAKYATNLGLVNIDAGKLANYLLTSARNQRADTLQTVSSTMDAVELVRAFLNEYHAHTLVTDVSRMVGKSGARNSVNVKSLPQRSPLLVHHAVNEKMLRFSWPGFRRWLYEDLEIPPLRIKNSLLKNAVERKINLGAGIPTISQVRQLCIEIDLSDERFESLFES